MKLTLDSDSRNDLEMIEQLAKRLGIRVVSTGSSPKIEYPELGSQTALQALEKLADYGGFPHIDDAVEWQRRQREDRNLEGTDE